MKDFLLFLINPYGLTENKENYHSILLLKSFIILVIFFCFSGLLKYTYSHINPLNGFYVLDKQYKSLFYGIIARRGQLVAFIIIGMIGPFVEELVFRLGFSFKKLHIYISVLSFIIYIPYIFSLKPIFIILVFVLCFPLVFIAYKRISQETINYFKAKYGAVVVHVIVLFFTILHLNNISPLNSRFFYEYLILLLPILVVSYIFSYIRIRAGFIYGVFLHMIFNSITFIAYIS